MECKALLDGDCEDAEMLAEWEGSPNKSLHSTGTSAQAEELKNAGYLYNEVAQERNRQDKKFGGPDVDDARKRPIDWIEDIEGYTAWTKQMHRMGRFNKYRRRMLQVAALAIAACQSYDRLYVAALDRKHDSVENEAKPGE